MAKTRKASRKGSRKASRKGTRKASSWAQSVKRVYAELKRKDRNASLGDAMKEASRRRKSGNL
jgi:hypothetical protein